MKVDGENDASPRPHAARQPGGRKPPRAGCPRWFHFTGWFAGESLWRNDHWARNLATSHATSRRSFALYAEEQPRLTSKAAALGLGLRKGYVDFAPVAMEDWFDIAVWHLQAKEGYVGGGQHEPLAIRASVCRGTVASVPASIHSKCRKHGDADCRSRNHNRFSHKIVGLPRSRASR